MTAAIDMGAQLRKLQEDLRKKFAADIFLVADSSLDKITHPASTIIVCENHLNPEEVIALSLKSKVKHIIQMNSIKFEREIYAAAELINESNKIFTAPEKIIFGENYTFNNRIYLKEFTSIDQKHETLDEIKIAIERKNCSQSLLGDIIAIADELFTNAIYHSGEDGDVERPRQLKNGKTAKIFIDADNDRILIGCIDPVGKLIPEKLLNRIHLCYTSDIAEKINMGSGGAGIGSYMVNTMSLSYYIAVDEGEKTLVGIVLPLNMSNRKRNREPKNLHAIFLRRQK